MAHSSAALRGIAALTFTATADVKCTLSWLVSDPQTLVMFGKTSDHPAGVQFLLMLPVRDEEIAARLLQMRTSLHKSTPSSAGVHCKLDKKRKPKV